METPRRRWLIAIAMLLVGIVMGAAVAWVVLTRPFTFGGGAGPTVESPPPSFSISGDVEEPFYPGGSAPLDLVIANPLETDLTISELRVEIDDVDAPNATTLLPCTPDDFLVEQLEFDELVVAAGSSESLTDLGVPTDRLPRVHMLDTETNQDGCKNASFSLAYSAVGRVVE